METEVKNVDELMQSYYDKFNARKLKYSVDISNRGLVYHFTPKHGYGDLPGWARTELDSDDFMAVEF